MDDKFVGMPEDLAGRGIRYTKEQLDQMLEQTEEFVRENPTRSLMYALAIGVVLNRLPMGRILGGLGRLALVAVKPAILIYGASKLYEATQNDDF
jgi:hypothetical protein